MKIKTFHAPSYTELACERDSTYLFYINKSKYVACFT